MEKLLPKEFLEDVVRLPYKPNPQNNPHHEKQVESLLKKHKIRYKAQPNGSQKFPDFRLLDYELNLECKSSVGYKPMWNRGLPRPDALYIITCKKLNRTNIFFGKYVLPAKKRKKLLENDIKWKKLIQDDQDDDDIFVLYPRLAFDTKIKNKPGGYKSFYWNDTHAKRVLNHFLPF
jgi:hypothetical protein